MLTSLTIAPRLGILMAATLLGLCAAGALAGTWMLDGGMTPLAMLVGLCVPGIGLAVGIMAWMIERSVGKPLAALHACMQDVAEGRFDGEIPGLGRGDEIGAMAAAVQAIRENAVRVRGLESRGAEAQAHAEANRRAKME